MKIIIPINAALQGFLLSIGNFLEQNGHTIYYVARDKHVKKLINTLLPQKKNECIDVKKDYQAPDDLNIEAECLLREGKYGERFSMLTSHDRALGKGYLLNVDMHPDIIRGWWDKEKKYKVILNGFLYYEYIIRKFSPDLILGYGFEKIIGLVAKFYNVKYYALAAPRYGDRYSWVENEYEHNFKYINKINEYLKLHSENKHIKEDVQLVQTKHAQYYFSKLNYSYSNALSVVLKRIVKETAQRIRGTSNKDGVRYLGWCKPLLLKPKIYNYLCSNGKKVSDLVGKKFVLFPLHFEPETSLMVLSSELNNSIEIITWISKSLPADYLLVVKEHPTCYGVRSTKYYDNLLRMANVVVAHPDNTSQEWLSVTKLLATITGTMGYEAIFFNKPVLSFGKHQIINNLPTVKYANNYDSTKEGIDTLLSIKEHDNIFTIAKNAFYDATMDSTFQLQDFAKFYYNDKQLYVDIAAKAIEGLMQSYNDVLISQNNKIND